MKNGNPFLYTIREGYIMKHLYRIKTKIRMILKNEWKTVIISVLCGTAVTAGAAVHTYADRVSQRITDSVVRFHVLANSDGENDQELKLKVRDEILVCLGEDLKECRSRDEAEKYLLAHLGDITETAERVIKEEGYEYDVKTELSEESYPVRYYGNAVFPGGVYHSLRVVIGEGKGHNWWCVMYPPLCLSGDSLEYSDTEILRDSLGDEGYDVVVLSSEETVPKIKFKVVEWFSSSGKSK